MYMTISPSAARWLVGARGGKLEVNFPAVALWKDAPAAMLGKLRVNVGDISWEKGTWVSKWLRGRTAELEYGSYTSSRGGSRWAKTAKKDLDNIGALTDCPIRFQVRNEMNGKRQ